MRPILSEQDFAVALSAEQAVIYFFVEWSVYAVRGRQRFAELESSHGRDSETSFWIADVSSVDAPAAFVADWLKAQDRSAFVMACAGGGPIVWLKSGVIVDVVQRAASCRFLGAA